MTAPAPARPSRARALWLGARPRTLGASIVPVLVGSAPMVSVPRFLLCLVVGLGMQVGVNYANDYFDGVRGVDTPDRLGPPRLVASGIAPARAVALAAAIAFACAAVAGVVLAAMTTWWLVAIGAVALLAAVLYSGGPRPYAGLGLGELSVFVFFGLVATGGSAYVQFDASLEDLAARGTRLDRVSWIPLKALILGTAVGCIAVAILVANNLRDIPTDAAAGKRTLAVRLGVERTRALFTALLVAAPLVVVGGVLFGYLPRSAIAALLAVPLGARAARIARRSTGRALIPALLATAAYQAAFGVLLAAAIFASSNFGIG